MKRLVDYLFGPRLRNKAGGMAWIRGLAGGGSEVLNNRAVRTVRLVNGRWQMEPRQLYVCTKNTVFPCGTLVLAGEVAQIAGIGDDYLEPWKDDGVTDSEVRELFAPQLPKEVPMSTEQKHRILSMLSKGPRAVKDFTCKTHADVQVHPQILRRWVAELEAGGMLEHGDDDVARITAAGLEEVNRPTSIASTRFHHFASQPPLQMKAWKPARSGALDFKACASKGLC